MLNQQSLKLFEPIKHTTNQQPFSIHYTATNPQSNLALYLHWHHEYELFYLQNGEALVSIDDEEYHLKANDAIFIPAGSLHMARHHNNAPCCFYAIVFSKDCILNSAPNAQYSSYVNITFSPILLRKGVDATTDTLLSRLKSIFDLYQTPIAKSQLSIHGQLLLIWQEIYNQQSNLFANSTTTDKLQEQFLPIFTYINEHLTEDFTLEHIAEIAHLSKGQFCRSFKKLTNETLFAYINRCRILKSCGYLNTSNLKIADIAIQCGFNNISYYNRQFQLIMKLTPREYRNAKI